MAKNTAPRFTIGGDVSSNGTTGMAPTITLAAADYTGVSANNALVFSADATNGGRIVGLHFQPAGSCTQTVARIYYNNGSTNTTASNNSLMGAITLPTTTASNTVAEPGSDFIFPGGAADLPAGFKIYVGLATAVSAGWVVTPILGGDF